MKMANQVITNQFIFRLEALYVSDEGKFVQ